MGHCSNDQVAHSPMQFKRAQRKDSLPRWKDAEAARDKWQQEAPLKLHPEDTFSESTQAAMAWGKGSPQEPLSNVGTAEENRRGLEDKMSPFLLLFSILLPVPPLGSTQEKARCALQPTEVSLPRAQVEWTRPKKRCGKASRK